ncbi:MAG: phosphoglucomutase/phosphomannomutase family protein [Candidatus Bipolaricaulota bacterium]
MESVKFGTDGWRAIIAREFTFDNVARVAHAVARFSRDPRRRDLGIYRDWGAEYRPAERGVVVGYDTRFLSEEFALHFARTLGEHGVPVVLSDGHVPTPALSYAVVDRAASTGVMITSSHNPPAYNGIKIKSEYGGSAPQEVTRLIEALLPAEAPSPRSGDADIERVDLRTPYMNRIRGLMDRGRLTASRIHAVVDSMYGSAAGYVAELLRESGVPFTQIRGTRDPLFGGKKPEPLEENLIPLRAVLRSRAGKGERLLGVITDGDGDRIAAMDETGTFIDPHGTYAIILRYLVEERGLRGAVVVSFNLTDLVRRMCAEYNLEVIEVPIGFKYAVEQILKKDVLMAGEESGSLALRGHIPERDGVLWSVLLCEILATSKRPASDLVKDLHRRFGPQAVRRRDIEIATRVEVVERLRRNPPERFGGEPVRAVETLDGLKLRFDNGWILFRASGTEPILRIYCEMENENAVRHMLDEGERFARGV